MEGSWRGILAALVVVAGLPASGSSNQIIEGPQNTTVLAGEEAHFNCTVSQGWRLIMWALNGTVVLSVTPKEPIITSDRFTSASYEEGGNFVSEMIIHDVQFSDAGRVKCSLQNSDSEGSAFLSVQVMGKLLTPSDSLVVIEDEPCNVTCHAVGWTPLPDLSWEIGAPVSHSSYHSVPEPDDPQSALSLLALTPQGNGTVTCVAKMKGLQVRDSLTINLTVVPPPPGSVDTAGAALPTWAIVLLAVSLSLLFILIIVLIVIFCCCCVSRKQEKESSYQSEIRLGTEGRFKGVGEPGRGPAGVPGAVETVGLAGWGAKAQETDQADKPGSGEGPRLPATPTAVQEQLQPLFRKSPNMRTNKETLEPKFRSGNENYGYSLDEQRTTQPASLLPEPHDASVPQRQSSGQAQQGPDHHQPGPTSRPQVTLYMAGPKQVRNVTLV